MGNGNLTPGFDPTITAYTVILGNDVTEVTVAGIPDDQKANIITSPPILDQFTPGVAQTSEITVTAPDGTSKSYILTVFIPLELQLEEKYADGHPSSIANHEFATLVQEGSGGQIRIEVLSGSTKDEATLLDDLENGEQACMTTWQ
ncbi:MAG: hypothetical protein A3J97_01295 [Spirochaetes bacterium RIFOXYC1_FULL_54_7]|nr:MAG: hypothetical protein A3J97_01295 [Spirochaetes bacterium RIFOXYC1_FULL_54_7]